MKSIKSKFKSRKKFKSSNGGGGGATAISETAKRSIALIESSMTTTKKAKANSTASNTTSVTSTTGSLSLNKSSSSTTLSGGALGTKLTSGSSNKGKASGMPAASTAPHKPAELYRLDFITAMKLPDTEMLDEASYWVIRDQWKLDWEKGVQVPVKTDLMKPNSMPKADKITVNESTETIKMPTKYLCPANDPQFKPNLHQAYLTHGLNSNSLNNTTKVCKYDCDNMDLLWLRRVNYELELIEQEKITRSVLEGLIENFELQAHHDLKLKLEKLNSYSLEFDQDTVCDVCRQPDSEENNEMVFCDGCNMCVHQACYGIEHIPQGSWLCAPCDFGGPQFRPECVLCPNSGQGGAMKATKTYRYWAHVACALWIPEVGFGDPVKMEPIVNLNKIPAAKWQLTCSLCKEKRGCCLQCAEKKCHMAFHVTCAFKFNLEMNQERLALSDDDEEPSSSGLVDQMLFKAYCLRHTKKRQQMMQNEIDEEEEEEEKENIKKQKMEIAAATADFDEKSVENLKLKLDSTSENGKEMEEAMLLNDDNDDLLLNLLSKMNENERKFEIVKRIQLLNKHFYKNVNLNVAKNLLNVKNQLHVDLVFNYWKLKRRFNVMTITTVDNTVLPVQNKPLMLHRNEQDMMNRNEQLLINTVKMFVQLRQNLERVRTLTYMTLKREKLKKQVLVNNSHEIFLKQVEYLKKYSSGSPTTSSASSSSSTTTPSAIKSLSNNVLQQKSINTIGGSSSSSSCSSTTINNHTSPNGTNNNANTITTSINSRLREILQLKNRSCIYDYPELWSMSRSKSGRLQRTSDVGVESRNVSPNASCRSSSSNRLKRLRSASKRGVSVVSSTASISTQATSTKCQKSTLRQSQFVNKIKNKYKSIKLNKKK